VLCPVQTPGADDVRTGAGMLRMVINRLAVAVQIPFPAVTVYVFVEEGDTVID